MKTIKLLKETNEIQRVLTLRNSRNNRHRYQEFILEGRLAIDEAYQKGWKIKALYYNLDRPLSNWAKSILAQNRQEVTYEISNALMERISDKSDCPEIVIIAEMQIRSFSSYEPESREVVVVLDTPKSAGNVGMMIRSAVAFGANGIVLSGRAADEYDPKCLRASVGTFFSIPIYRVEGVEKFNQKVEDLKLKRSVQLVVSGQYGSSSIEEIHVENDLIFLILGNETHGVNAGYQKIATQFVRIPLPGKFASLNVAAAGSIFLYEIFRNRSTTVSS